MDNYNFFQKLLEKKFSNPFYVNLIIFSLIFHLDLLIALFLTSGDYIFLNTGLLKDEYIKQTYFLSTDFWVRELLAVGVTIFSVWFFPKWFLNSAYKEELENDHLGNRTKLDHELDLVNLKVNIEKAKSTEKEEIRKQEKIDPTEIWENDYTLMSLNGYEWKFKNLVKEFYSGARGFSYFNPEDLSYFVSLGLVKTQDGQVTGITEKGDFFLRKSKEKVGTTEVLNQV